MTLLSATLVFFSGLIVFSGCQKENIASRNSWSVEKYDLTYAKFINPFKRFVVPMQAHFIFYETVLFQPNKTNFLTLDKDCTVWACIYTCNALKLPVTCNDTVEGTVSKMIYKYNQS